MRRKFHILLDTLTFLTSYFTFFCQTLSLLFSRNLSIRLRLSAGEYAPTYPLDLPSLAQFGSEIYFIFNSNFLFIFHFFFHFQFHLSFGKVHVGQQDFGVCYLFYMFSDIFQSCPARFEQLFQSPALPSLPGQYKKLEICV
jgi:hypothetical protein